MPTDFLPATVTRCSALWPCTSALGDRTRKNSADSAKLLPSSKVTVRTRRSLSSRSSVGHGSAIACTGSAEVDRAVDHMLELGALGREHHLHLELALAAEAFLADHLLDGLLGGHAHFFQVFAHRHIKALFVHARSPMAFGPML